MNGFNGDSVAHTGLRPWLRVLIIAEFAVLAAFVAPASAQDRPEVDPLLGVVDDPTYLARSIDQRMSEIVADCLSEAGFDYEVAPNARFDLVEVAPITEDVVIEESGMRDLLPRVIDPVLVQSDFLDFAIGTVAPEPVFVPPTVEPVVVAPELDTIPPAVLDPPQLAIEPPSPEITDLRLRIDPIVDGYGVAFDSFTVDTPDPNIERVRSLSATELVAYERAFYGTALRDITASTEPAGCAARIEDALTTEIVPEMETLQDDLEVLTERVESSPDFTTALDQWSECVAATDIGAQVGTLDSPDDAVELVADEYATLTDATLSRLDEVRALEIELATADYACRAQTTDLAITAVLLREGGDYAANVLRVGAAISEGDG